MSDKKNKAEQLRGESLLSWLRDPHVGRPSYGVILMCSVCGEFFWKRPSQADVEQGRGKYCSHKCQAADPAWRKKISEARMRVLEEKSYVEHNL